MAATQGKACEAGIGDGSPRGGEAKRLGLAVELAPLDPTLGAYRAADGIDPDTFHQG
jgi:hypothetical protein